MAKKESWDLGMVFSKGFTTEHTEHTEGREEALRRCKSMSWMITNALISFFLLCDL
jgi:hypothetical protein